MSTTKGVRLVTLAQIARELGVDRTVARKELDRIKWAFEPIGNKPRWDPRCLDLLQALRGRPHRTLEPAHSDWLNAYLKEKP